ncbi:MAG: radical SAM protein [Rickettsiales bacterium]|nr:radical SAM protein [Rickettsiales bacterium]|tara:strand:- start:1911 stop:2879 length:969 start_codon:yes stop_codon:yes gene_type:complete
MLSISFDQALQDSGEGPLLAGAMTWLQVNLGKLCNQACHHCHVDAGPKRSEVMSAATADRVIALMRSSPQLELLDLTGGAPELNPSFRKLVRAGRQLGLTIIDRCNLSILLEPGQEDLLEFLVEQRVNIVASLPCYLEANVDRQRGRGIYNKSIHALQLLNAAGYGRPDSDLQLDLVYNPVGAHLPPEQSSLEADYRCELRERFGIEFSHLLTITNMPIARFAQQLRRDGSLDDYLQLLRDNFNAGTIAGLMCRNLLSISWDGRLFDCDFNQMLEMPLVPGQPHHIADLGCLNELQERRIRTAQHCFGCTAGSGSSCGGAIA